MLLRGNSDVVFVYVLNYSMLLVWGVGSVLAEATAAGRRDFASCFSAFLALAVGVVCACAHVACAIVRVLRPRMSDPGEVCRSLLCRAAVDLALKLNTPHQPASSVHHPAADQGWLSAMLHARCVAEGACAELAEGPIAKHVDFCRSLPPWSLSSGRPLQWSSCPMAHQRWPSTPRPPPRPGELLQSGPLSVQHAGGLSGKRAPPRKSALPQALQAPLLFAGSFTSTAQHTASTIAAFGRS